MAKFNQELTKLRYQRTADPHNTINRAGGLAYQDAPRMALYRQVATSLWSGDGYYERQRAWFERFQQNVGQVLAEDVRFPFALAAYARDKQGLALRTSSVALYVEALAHKAAKGSGYARQYAPRVMLRADEPAEALAYFRKHHTGIIPHGLLRGIADVLEHYDEYQLAKYKRTGAFSMRDVLRLARPKPAHDAQRALWGRVVARNLATPYTWEVELSKATTEEAKRRIWNELIDAGKLGLFALVRNLHNIAASGANLSDALMQITEERVRTAGILPFQWYKAYRVLAEQSCTRAAEQLQHALIWSLAGMPKLAGRTLVVCDNSGSMWQVSATRGMSNADIGNLMGALALCCCEYGVAATFGDTVAVAKTDLRHSVFANKQAIDQCGATTGYATNAWKIFEWMIRDRVDFDRIILFSDMQCYDTDASWGRGYVGTHSLSGELNSYLCINPAAVIYSINLASQDNTCQFASNQPVVELAGWSESIFQFLQATEEGDSILQHILEYY